MMIVMISYRTTKPIWNMALTSIEAMARNMNGGKTTKKANLANARPLSSENQPRRRARLPQKIIAKNGMVIDRMSSIRVEPSEKLSHLYTGKTTDLIVSFLLNFQLASLDEIIQSIAM